MYLAEKKVVRFAVMMICIALIIIYAIRYQVKGKHLRLNSPVTQEDTSTPQNNTITMYDDQERPITGMTQDTTQKNVDSTTSFRTMSWWQTSDVAVFNGTNNQNPYITGETDQQIRMLSGTELYLEEVEGIKRLSISYQYILRDEKNIYYANLWNKEYDFNKIAKILGGSTYSLDTQEEILQNQLFGDSIQFINIPEYKDKIVLMYVKVNGQQWLLHIDYATYHGSKEYLKTLFTD